MKWAIPALVGYAEGVGWTGNDLTLAVAVALATSDGDDAWSWSAGGVPPPTQLGLWGIDPAAVEANVASKLTDPTVNAGVAVAIWRANDQSWVWSPAWSAGAWRSFLPTVRDVIASKARGQSDTQAAPIRSLAGATDVARSVAAQASNVGAGAVAWLRDRFQP